MPLGMRHFRKDGHEYLSLTSNLGTEVSESVEVFGSHHQLLTYPSQIESDNKQSLHAPNILAL